MRWFQGPVWTDPEGLEGPERGLVQDALDKRVLRGADPRDQLRRTVKPPAGPRKPAPAPAPPPKARPAPTLPPVKAPPPPTKAPPPASVGVGAAPLPPVKAPPSPSPSPSPSPPSSVGTGAAPLPPVGPDLSAAAGEAAEEVAAGAVEGAKASIPFVLIAAAVVVALILARRGS